MIKLNIRSILSATPTLNQQADFDPPRHCAAFLFYYLVRTTVWRRMDIAWQESMKKHSAEVDRVLHGVDYKIHASRCMSFSTCAFS